MTLSRGHRALTAWMLYCSLLLSLFACGTHHGQAAGLSLSGLDGGFCSLANDPGLGIDLGGSGQDVGTLPMNCPLCSSFGTAVALNSAGWNLDSVPAAGGPLPIALHWAQPPPRFLRHSLNPRASPAPFLA